MTTITANDLKRGGVSALAAALAEDAEATITVRGKQRFVVMSTDHYNRLREYELTAAVAEVKADYEIFPDPPEKCPKRKYQWFPMMLQIELATLFS
jgi:prevent-host-death family protein